MSDRPNEGALAGGRVISGRATRVVGRIGAASLVLLFASLNALAGPVSARPEPQRPCQMQVVLDIASEMQPLRAVIVSQHGRVVAERGYGRHTVDTPTNIKSASKTVLSALVGIAIDKGILQGTQVPVATALPNDLPSSPDPRLRQITIGHLLSMQAGLQPTSGPHYGRWVASEHWVRAALAQPLVDEPGGAMLYSTGSSHLLSAILARATGRSTLALAREWLGPQDGFLIAAWDRDPQGIHFGGNNMSMSARSLMAFGEIYRNRGRAADGTRVLSRQWIEQSWTQRTQSRYTGDAYGYGWFLRTAAGHEVRYAWGYGGQMLYVIPTLGLTVAMVSDATQPSARSGHRDDLHRLLARIIKAAATAKVESSSAATNRPACAAA